ncbi:MAG TPA: OmpA family protein [Stellaceae bacterium]|jgi:OOP family OmpA-OmpF porin|nr:OmpA family protein [Stellaceae bacterium]
MHQRNIIATSLALLSAGALAACSGWSGSPPMRGNPVLQPFNLPAAQSSAPAPGGTFDQNLAGDYAGFATQLVQQQGDYADSDYFARKGLAAGHGQTVLPEQNSNWLVPLEVPLDTRTELGTGRNRLMTVLDNGARDRSPELAARAQERYDCWVEGMEKDWRSAIHGTCHAEFVDALNQLEGRVQPAAAPAAPPVTARQYNVYFDWNKSDLTSDARQIIDKVAEQVKSDNSHVALTGKADLSGTDAYNMTLSHHRADAVREALVADGVPAGQIEERWVGMREPPVPTAKGVREPRNRVVEVAFH